MASISSTVQSPPVRWKAVAIPPEHGAWGFLMEPIIAGLIVAPSLPGVLLALGILGVFLLRHPSKIVYQDYRRGKRYARTSMALQIGTGYILLALVGTLAALLLAGPIILLPLPLTSPLAVLLLIGVFRNQGRGLWAELAGASALAGTAASIALAGGASIATALMLWVILLGRNVPSVLFIRARLRLDRGKPAALTGVVIANVVAVMVGVALVMLGYAPVLAVVALALLMLRALYGISPFRKPLHVRTMGFLEMGFGLLTALLLGVGTAAGW